MDIEYIRKRYDVDAYMLKRIMTLYGSIDTFCVKYLDELIKENKIESNGDMDGYFINYFDLSNPYTVGDYSGYANLLMDVCNLKPGFISYEPIDCLLEETMREILSKEEIYILENAYKLKGKSTSDADMCKELNVKSDKLGRIKRKCVKKISSYLDSTKLQKVNRIIVDGPHDEAIFFGILRKEDAFFSKEQTDISEKKIQLVFNVLEKNVEGITYNGGISYIEESYITLNKINKSILSKEMKDTLRDRVNQIVSQIAEGNREELVEYFREEIGKLGTAEDSKSAAKIVEKFLKSSGLDTTTVEELLKSAGDFYGKKEEKFEAYRLRMIPQMGFPHMNERVDDLEISNKTKETMVDVGFIRIADLVEFSPKELLNLRALEKGCAEEVIQELKRLGYDISADSTMSIEEYNQDKINRDNYQAIVNEIQNSGYTEYFKSYLLGVLLKKTVNRLKKEYDELGKAVAMYKDVAKTHKRLAQDRSTYEMYQKKIIEAQTRKKEINGQLEELTKKR